MRKVPFTITIFIISTIIVLRLSSVDFNVNILRNFGAIHTAFPLQEQLLNVVAYQFIHSNWYQYISNMTLALIFTSYLEYLIGTVKTSIIYLIGGTLVGIATLIFTTNTVIVVGASGAIFCVLGALLYLSLTTNMHRLNKYAIGGIIIIWLFDTMISTNINVIGHFSGLTLGIIIALMIEFITKEETNEYKTRRNIS